MMENSEEKETDTFGGLIKEKEARKLKTLHDKKESEWFGLKMFGMVGWSIVVPTFFGALAGIWLDKSYPQSFSWTVTLLVLGLACGCYIAWNWIIKER